MRLKIKIFRSHLIAVILMIAIAFSGLSPVVSAAETADFNQFNASQIVYEMGAGWNLGNQLEATTNGWPSETAWGNPAVTQALIQKVKAAGFKTIRIPVSYLNYIGSGPNYTIDSTWLSRVKTVVDYAYSEGLYVIINVHGDGYTNVAGSWLLVNSSDQTTVRAKYQKVWQQIANTFVNYDEKLIFESMNEVFDGTWGTPNPTYYSNLNTLNQVFVNTVRQSGGNNAARWLLIPGWNTNIDYTAGNYGFVLPTDNYRSSTVPSSEKRIMISVHYYSPWDFAGEETGTITQWGATATNTSKKSTWGQEDYLDSQFKSMYDKFVTQGYPVVIGEFGSIDKTAFDSANDNYRAEFAKAVTATAKKYGSVPVYWDNGHNGQYGFGLFDRSTYAITEQGIINAIMSAIGTSNGGSNYKIKNVGTGLFIDGMGRTANGSNAGQYSSSTSNNQRWVLENYGSYYKIKNVGTGLYLDGMYRTTAGSICGQYSNSDSWNQRWILEPNGSNYRIKNQSTGLYLDSGGTTTNGADLKQWTSSTSTNLQWQLVTP
ncbi:cellulase family glycosylhydrolase [Paenibacillus sp. sptzw28]|uniref:cellulase family glycosylhydrolase n=1 Tax=Paenibacillus sp. sptzw28 TaxID=715179 RepID=UPI001C6DE7B3|nr:cellulase family glycosylhydrolase [Paenibacillus sp. sptzw28]QYR21757.1 cellulase family glycosylhydrolase [Paenibacillus sp. sptzw28]